jgi:hypothetical protein
MIEIGGFARVGKVYWQAIWPAAFFMAVWPLGQFWIAAGSLFWLPVWPVPPVVVLPEEVLVVPVVSCWTAAGLLSWLPVLPVPPVVASCAKADPTVKARAAMHAATVVFKAMMRLLYPRWT